MFPVKIDIILLFANQLKLDVPATIKYTSIFSYMVYCQKKNLLITLLAKCAISVAISPAEAQLPKYKKIDLKHEIINK